MPEMPPAASAFLWEFGNNRRGRERTGAGYQDVDFARSFLDHLGRLLRLGFRRDIRFDDDDILSLAGQGSELSRGGGVAHGGKDERVVELSELASEVETETVRPVGARDCDKMGRRWSAPSRTLAGRAGTSSDVPK